MTRSLRFVFPILSVGFLAAGYLMAGLPWPGLGMLAFGVLWIVALALRWDWFPTLALFVTFGAAAFGLFLGLSPVVFIPGALIALAAWDLAGFHVRLQLADAEDDLAPLEKRHLLRLAGLIVTGGMLSAFALSLHVSPSFEWVVVLVFVAIWGIGRVVSRLLKKDL
jgi:hypothetical protein